MKYDLSNPMHRKTLRVKVARILEKPSGIVELRECKQLRSIRQNSYLHLLISYFALQVGERAEDVKREYYKLEANRETFLRSAVSRVTGQRVERLRSSAELTSHEMTLTIDRFRNWSAAVAGIYLPSPTDFAAIEQMQIEVERAKEWM